VLDALKIVGQVSARWFPSVLALEITTAGRPAKDPRGPSPPRSRDERCQPPVGSAAASLRTAQAPGDVGQTTVAKYMARRRRPPSQGGKTFLRNHAHDIASIDLFFVHPISFASGPAAFTAGSFCGWGVTAHASAGWIARQLTETCGWSDPPRYLIRDRDRAYGGALIRRLRAMGIRDRPISARSPWQSGLAERPIGSIRRDCLDHVAIFGEEHLRR
jgi:hypothetical protein